MVPFLEKMTVGDIAGLKTSESKLSLIMNANGGIEDDTVISNAGNYIYMVVNGACKQKDINHFEKYVCFHLSSTFLYCKLRSLCYV